jgi:hypothetical protein
MNTANPDLLSTARAAAAELLAEHAGKASLSSLLTLAYLRGCSDGHAEATKAALRTIESKREAAQ